MRRLTSGCAVLLMIALIGAGHARLAPVTFGHASSRPGGSVAGFRLLLAHSRDLGRVPSPQTASFLLLLRDRGAAGEARAIAAMYDPRSRHFGHFATPAQIEKYGPARSDLHRIGAALRRASLTGRWSAGDAWISVAGRASAIYRVFHVWPHRYLGPDGRAFIASARDPVVPRSLRGIVRGTSHIETYRESSPLDIPTGGLAPTNLLSAYDIAPLRGAGIDGTGETVVFFEIDGFRQSDLDAYTRRFHLPPMHPVIAAGPRLSPGGEAPMDLEAVHAIAPGARLVVYNLDQQRLSQTASSDAQFLDSLLNFQRRIVNENPRAIVSNSVGSCAEALGRGAATAFKQVYDRADALGEAWFAASGDQGAYDCLQSFEQQGDPPSQRDIGVDLPASAPGVTGVGGTRLSLRSDGTWYREETWEGPAETDGGGGGVSGFFARPTWQRAPGVLNPSFDRQGMREVPDVSAVADPATSGAYAIGGSYVREGGTSQAAPIWAGLMALADEYMRRNGGHRLGFANPALYAIARPGAPYPAFHDVTVGSNLVYPATPGYDMASGLGTPDGWNLARDLLAYEKGRVP
jgi:kumamolisin